MNDNRNVNDYFDDLPIDYFKITPENLLEFAPGGKDEESADEAYRNELQRISKDFIEPNEDGKVYDSLKEKLELYTKNTCVINIGVGQGKTYTILKIVEEYFTNDEEVYIIIAVPYVSLVQQYVNELVENGIPENDIYRYEWLNPTHQYLSKLSEQLKRRVHVVTANCLLGNAGENSVINSKIKRNYLQNFPKALTAKTLKYDGEFISEENVKERLDKYSELLPLQPGEDLSAIYKELFDPSKISFEISSKKVILIFDEIHDAVHNFTETNIFNLNNWEDVLQKIFLLSATFDDPSLVIINQLSKLTDGKIQILESERKAIREKQSDLYIHFDANNKFDENNSTILEIVKKAISEEKTIDILLSSKNLAKSLFNGEVGDLLKTYAGTDQVKLCASELIANQRATIDEPQNRYDGSKINIGTNFKTGININKENHCFIIILPSSSAKMPFENFYGIFSNGYIDIVQALARQRKKGEIHVVTMFHENMDLDSLPEEWTSTQKYHFEREYKNTQNLTERTKDLSRDEIHSLEPEEIVKYTLLNEQSDLINAKYLEILKPILAHALNNNLDFIKNKEKFRTEKGKMVLSRNRFFVEDISGNLAINAFTNQFINCRLAGVFGATLYFTDEDFERKLGVMYDEKIEESRLVLNDLYKDIKNDLFTNKVIYNKKLITTSDQKFNKKIAKYILKKRSRNNESELFGTEIKSQHLIYHILTNDNLYFESVVIPEMKKVFRNLEEIIITNQNSQYLPTNNKEIFAGVDVNKLYDKLLEEFPIFIDLGLLKKLESDKIEEKKNQLYNIFSKTLGEFDQSRTVGFSTDKMKKISRDSGILTRLFS